MMKSIKDEPEFEISAWFVIDSDTRGRCMADLFSWAGPPA